MGIILSNIPPIKNLTESFIEKFIYYSQNSEFIKISTGYISVESILFLKKNIELQKICPFELTIGMYAFEGMTKRLFDAVSSLAEYMKKSLALVFPSLHETFGLPILEAVCCGLPVITSDRTACPEIAGDAGLIVNPRNEDEIAQAMVKIAADANLREDLRIYQYTWLPHLLRPAVNLEASSSVFHTQFWRKDF